MRYAVVPSRGTYSQSSRVRAVSVHASLAVARAAAERATRAYQRAMRPHGGPPPPQR